MSVTRIIAVRHGETEWNKIGKQQGHLDSPLTELGRRQAAAMGHGLIQFPIEAFYSSDLGRACETASIISSIIKRNFITDARFRERNLGSMQGLTRHEFAGLYPREAERFGSIDPDYRIPRGESVRERHDRNIECAEELAKDNRGKTILVVVHGGVLMSFMYRSIRIPLDHKRTFSLYNGSINGFSIDGNMEWNLDFWGDTNHLRSEGLSALDDN
jgi:2,3-bisphosphoglycerate-dependent phosphoglycerate mutase